MSVGHLWSRSWGLNTYLPTSWAQAPHWTWLLYLPVKNVQISSFYVLINTCKVYSWFLLVRKQLTSLSILSCSVSATYHEEEQGHKSVYIVQKLPISSLLPAKELAWVWAQQKAWRVYPSKSAGYRHPLWFAGKEWGLVQPCHSSNTPPQSSGTGFVRFASRAPVSRALSESATDFLWSCTGFQQIGNNLSLIMTASNIVQGWARHVHCSIIRSSWCLCETFAWKKGFLGCIFRTENV